MEQVMEKIVTAGGMIIRIPSYYQLEESADEDAAGAVSYTVRTTNANGFIRIFPVGPEQSMPLKKKENIQGLRETLLENQALIEVETGKDYGFSIVRTLKTMTPGVQYILAFERRDMGRVLRVQGLFEESGVTGKRESLVFELCRREGLVEIDGDTVKGWNRDPYETNCTDGLLMNLSEQEEYDAMFPDHPLTLCRELVSMITGTNRDNTPGKKGRLKSIASAVKEKASVVDMSVIRDKAAQAGGAFAEKADDLKNKAIETKDDITEKLTELDRMLEQSITEYNDAFMLMNDQGLQLFIERTGITDMLWLTEDLINSIANHPKSFDSELQEIDIKRKEFINCGTFAERELNEARKAAGGAGAGLAAGASVAFMAPTAAMWVATTFGTASTGTAISALSGAAASNAALAWLGGGAIAAGGGGMSAGSAFLALAGPVGWTIAGATLLSSILIFAKKRTQLNKQKNEEIESVKRNTEIVMELKERITFMLEKTKQVRSLQKQSYRDCMKFFDKDYQMLNETDKQMLGALVNYSKAMAAMLGEQING